MRLGQYLFSGNTNKKEKPTDVACGRARPGPVPSLHQGAGGLLALLTHLMDKGRTPGPTACSEPLDSAPWQRGHHALQTLGISTQQGLGVRKTSVTILRNLLTLCSSTRCLHFLSLRFQCFLCRNGDGKYGKGFCSDELKYIEWKA